MKTKTIRLRGKNALQWARCAKLTVSVDGCGMSPPVSGLTPKQAEQHIYSESMVPESIWLDVTAPEPKRRAGRPYLEDERPEAREVVGRMPDAAAAKHLGCSRAAVKRARERLGLPLWVPS